MMNTRKLSMDFKKHFIKKIPLDFSESHRHLISNMKVYVPSQRRSLSCKNNIM